MGENGSSRKTKTLVLRLRVPIPVEILSMYFVELSFTEINYDHKFVSGRNKTSILPGVIVKIRIDTVMQFSIIGLPTMTCL